MMMEDETEVFKSDNPSDNLRKISSEAQKRKSTPAKGTYNPSTVGVLEQLASTSPRSNSGNWIIRSFKPSILGQFGMLIVNIFHMKLSLQL